MYKLAWIVSVLTIGSAIGLLIIYSINASNNSENPNSVAFYMISGIMLSAIFNLSRGYFICNKCGKSIFTLFGLPSIFPVRRCSKCGNQIR